MGDTSLDYEQIALMALQLSPADKARLIERLAFRLRYDIGNTPAVTTDQRSLLGILKDLGPAPSAEEIDEARREMWPAEYLKGEDE